MQLNYDAIEKTYEDIATFHTTITYSLEALADVDVLLSGMDPEAFQEILTRHVRILDLLSIEMTEESKPELEVVK